MPSETIGERLARERREQAAQRDARFEAQQQQTGANDMLLARFAPDDRKRALRLLDRYHEAGSLVANGVTFALAELRAGQALEGLAPERIADEEARVRRETLQRAADLVTDARGAAIAWAAETWEKLEPTADTSAAGSNASSDPAQRLIEIEELRERARTLAFDIPPRQPREQARRMIELVEAFWQEDDQLSIAAIKRLLRDGDLPGIPDLSDRRALARQIDVRLGELATEALTPEQQRRRASLRGNLTGLEGIMRQHDLMLVGRIARAGGPELPHPPVDVASRRPRVGS